MRNKCMDIWEKTKNHINNTINNVKESQIKIEKKLKDCEKKIINLREELPYADREDKLYMREELNRVRDKYDKLSREGNEKDTELFINSPYFCKVSTENDSLYISKYKKDIINDVFLFTDNIAKLRFYNVGECEKINGHNHKVVEKIDYIIEGSHIKELTHYEKDLTYKFDGQDIIVIKGEMPKVKKAIKTDSDRKIAMQEIIDRMKLEQDTVMRAPEVGITLISGGAGTGKTNIAIHRLRYLLNEFSEMFKEENMAIVCYNVALKEYLSNVIGDLNLTKVKVFSYDKWAYSIVRNYSKINYINYGANLKEDTEAAYKTVEYANILENYVRNLKDNIEEDITSSEVLKFYIPENYMFNEIVTIQDIFELRNEIKDGIEGISDYEEVLKSVDDELTKIMKSYYVTDISFHDKTFTLNAANMFYKIYTSQELKEVFKETFFYYKLLFQNRANKYELYSIVYLLSLIAGDFNEDLKMFDHIAVDEVQDFLPIQLKTLNSISAYSMTLTGDVNQKIFSTGMNKWEELGVEVNNFYTLKEIHRSTVQTVNFANSLVGNKDKIINDNSGQKPVINICKDLNDSLKDVAKTIDKIKKNNKDATIVVLHPQNTKINYINKTLNDEGIDSYVALKDEWDFNKEVAVTNYHQVKGLEFDYVIALGLNEFENYGFNNKEKVLYTILTRAKERVYMYCYDEIIHMFKGIDKELYEVQDIRE